MEYFEEPISVENGSLRKTDGGQLVDHEVQRISEWKREGSYKEDEVVKWRHEGESAGRMWWV